METTEIAYCRGYNPVVTLRAGIACDGAGQRRDACFFCGRGFWVSDLAGYPHDCPHCNAVLRV